MISTLFVDLDIAGSETLQDRQLDSVTRICEISNTANNQQPAVRARRQNRDNFSPAHLQRHPVAALEKPPRINQIDRISIRKLRNVCP